MSHLLLECSRMFEIAWKAIPHISFRGMSLRGGNAFMQPYFCFSSKWLLFFILGALYWVQVWSLPSFVTFRLDILVGSFHFFSTSFWLKYLFFLLKMNWSTTFENFSNDIYCFSLETIQYNRIMTTFKQGRTTQLDLFLMSPIENWW